MGTGIFKDVPISKTESILVNGLSLRGWESSHGISDVSYYLEAFWDLFIITMNLFGFVTKNFYWRHWISIKSDLSLQASPGQTTCSVTSQTQSQHAVSTPAAAPRSSASGPQSSASAPDSSSSYVSVSKFILCLPFFISFISLGIVHT